MTAELGTETRDRIYTVANELFEQSGRSTFPTVDAVRRAARCNMNEASAVMKEWRRMQTTKTAQVAVVVPDAVQVAGSQAIAALWQQAQELANESLRAAQAGWDAERGQLDAMRGELADNFDRQAAELDAAQKRIDELEKELSQQRDAVATAERQAALSAQQVADLNRRTDDLKAELNRAHQDADRQAEAAAKAREEAAMLRGRLEVYETLAQQRRQDGQ